MTLTTAPAVVFRDAQRLDECPICRSARLRHKLTDGDYHYQIVGQFSADECQDCALVFVNPMPSARDLAALYPDDYYAYQPPRLPHPLCRRSGAKESRGASPATGSSSSSSSATNPGSRPHRKT